LSPTRKHREDDAEVASSTSTEEGKAGFGWAKAKKLDDDEKGNSDSDSVRLQAPITLKMMRTATAMIQAMGRRKLQMVNTVTYS
jgi:hypothetical protein